MNNPDYKKILLSLIASLTLCDHMGDVSDDVSKALDDAGINIEWDDLHELAHGLAKMGVTTLYGTTIASEPCEVEDCKYWEEA